MQVRQLQTKEEVRFCTDMYCDLNDDSFIDVNRNESYYNLLKLVKNNAFARVIVRDDKILAWILAQKMQPLHMDYPIFQQMYYASKESGVLAYKCVIKLHEAMIEEAKRLKIGAVLSQGSHMDSDYTFTRILEKSGWSRRGYVAILKLPQEGARLGLPDTFLSR